MERLPIWAKSMEKREIRKKTLQMRGKLSENYRMQADDKICRSLESFEGYRKAKCILSYVSYKSEVDTKKILEEILEIKE